MDKHWLKLGSHAKQLQNITDLRPVLCNLRPYLDVGTCHQNNHPQMRVLWYFECCLFRNSQNNLLLVYLIMSSSMFLKKSGNKLKTEDKFCGN